MHRSLFALTLLAAVASTPLRAESDTFAGDPLAAVAAPAATAPAAQATRVSLLAEASAVAPGARVKIAAVIEHAPHKHTYWSNPGDTGTVTEIAWKNTPGVTVGPLRHPAPKTLNVGGILSFVHEGRTALLAEVAIPATAKPGETITLKGTMSWLECDDASCLPGEAEVSLRLPVAAATVAGPDAAAITAAEDLLPDDRAPASATLQPGDTKTAPAIVIPATVLAERDTARATLFPAAYGAGENDEALNQFALAKPEKLADGSLRFTHPKVGAPLKPASIRAIVDFGTGKPLAVITDTPGRAAAVTTGATVAKPGAGDDKPTFALALLLALGGGILLNIMPCVFPVLGLKIYGFVNKAGGDARAALRHGLAFAAGIVVSFWALAGALVAVRGVAAGWLGASEGELGWGFLQQMPGFNVAIATLFLVMALGMCGVFEFGTGVQNAAGSVREREGYLGSFLSGALTTIVATPCSGPGMAPAISYALAASAGESFAVFTALALGLAAPFVVFSASPKLLARLPRPGAWMESFKQGMSFLLFGSFAYFVWILSGQLEEQSMLLTLFAFTAIAFGVWIYGRWTAPERTDAVRRRAMVLAAAVVLGSLAFIITRLPKSATTASDTTASAVKEIVWTPWSPAAQAAALAEGKTVYIDFTARWCLTCQANKWVYHDGAVKTAFADRGVVALKADWSNRDKGIAAELAKYGKVTIPFNVVLRRDATPLELPAVLTPGAVTDAVSAR